MQHFSLPIFSHFLIFTVSLVYLKTTDEILMTETSSFGSDSFSGLESWCLNLKI